MLIDDHKVVVDGLVSLLKDDPQLEVVGAFTDSDKALQFLDTEHVDVLITDLDMPGKSGEDVLWYCKSKFPKLKIIVLSMHDDSEVIKHLIELDADGYLIKSSGKQEIVASIKLVHSGVKHFGDDVIQAVMQDNQNTSSFNPALHDLTAREIEIIKLVAEGLSTKEVADKLSISARTVETHRSNLLKKIDATGVAGIIRFAFEHDLVD